ncbi:protein sorting system archaetidylserine synthase [Halodesulfurarchaeum formicicum]|uniref:CDP-diacylglycerol-serine O-phosphatidyltransferase n=1 Tax=Halodesulfurarchaeum formicicum TaxID=1873524 RepID=A0A1J1AC86_9EURY|nr:protein sorting system archaetidylserine synthase [Halodesulfurarchaeum formicicum]APE95758.1 CDP-diacylglycerol-serine O-phosphatidyltransferase [Halodesulfurarchaeum formicicum]
MRRALRALGPADLITAANAAIGFVAVALAPVDPAIAARLILLAGIADALDGIVARRWGGSEVGEFLDSLADVASFGVAPAAMVIATLGGAQQVGVGIAFGAIFVGAAVLRLALYTAYDTNQAYTHGVQTTLAATILAAGLLSGVPTVGLLSGLFVFALLMLGEMTYPDLRVRDAVVMGGIQTAAILAPMTLHSIFPRGLLAWALAYLLLGPWFYDGAEGKRS